jgi:uncharacterized membrane protein YfcA
MFATFIGIKMVFGRESWNIGSELPGRATLSALGLFTGFMSALVGVSGGSISNTVLTLYGKPMQQAVATSAGLGVPITTAGALGYVLAGWRYQAQLPPLSIGFVSVIGFALMAPISSYTASYGVGLAHWLSRRQLEIAFGIFLMLASLRFLASLIW